MSAVRPASRFLPEIGRSVSATVVRLVIAAVLVGLCFAIVGLQPIIAVTLFLALAALAFPKTPAIWILAAALAALSLGAAGAAPSGKFFVVLAAAHLLHLCGLTLGWLPSGGRVQLRVIGRMLRTFVIIQVPAQLVSLVVLGLLAGRSVAATLTSPAFGIVAGACFVLLVVLVVVPALRPRAA